MAGPGIISLEIKGKEKVLAAIGAFRMTVQDLRPFWRDVFAPKYFDAVQDVFTMEGQRRGPTGRFAHGAWAPLSPRYKAWKDKHYPDKGILERTGALRDSLTWNHGALGEGGIFDAQPLFAIVGTDVPYARAHQRGVSDRNLPARPFLDPPDPRVFRPLLQSWLVRNARQRGLKGTK